MILNIDVIEVILEVKEHNWMKVNEYSIFRSALSLRPPVTKWLAKMIEERFQDKKQYL